MQIKLVSIVIPCFNEDTVIDEFYKRIQNITDKISEIKYEFIFINDGSVDKTENKLNKIAELDQRVRVLHLASNRGHQNAITAGIDYANGDFIATIDADLQDPPEVITEMILKAKEGFDIVHAQRKIRSGESRFKLFTAWLFYKIINFLTNDGIIENCGDFRGFTKPVLDAIKNYREPHRFLRGLFVNVGFRQCVVKYDRDKRFAGKTKYPFSKMVRLALNAVVSFSTSPIKLISWISILLWGFSLIYLAISITVYVIFPDKVEAGWTSIIILLFFFSGLQLFCIGILGTYIGRIFEQGQNRPLYWIRDARNIHTDKFQ